MRWLAECSDMNLYRTGESGLVPVTALDPEATEGLATALLRGRGGELGGDDLLFLSRTTGGGTATALAVDAEGGVVVVTAVDGEVGDDAVTAALRDASNAATQAYEELNDAFEGEGALREAHADYFDREPLTPAGFNDDQRVRLLAPAFDSEALDLAGFLSRKQLSVRSVRVDAFDAGEGEFLVRFGTPDGEPDSSGAEAMDTAGSDGESDTETGGYTESDESGQWVAGEGGASDETQDGAAVPEGREAEEEPVVSSDESRSDGSEEESLDAVATVSEPSADRVGDGTENGGGGADADSSASAGDGEGTESDEAPDGGTASGEMGTDAADGASEELELPTLLEAVSEGVGSRLVGTFQGDVEELVSVERGNELLIRPDHSAYAGGVLRYRLSPDPDGGVEFEVNIYGGSEAEKEQMRAVVRENEEAIEEELGYGVADRYDGFHGHEEYDRLDRDAATDIVDEFDRLVRFFHPRVMRSWRDSR